MGQITTTNGSASAASAHGVRLTRRGRLLLVGGPTLIAILALMVLMLFAAGSLVNQAQAADSEVPGVEATEVTVAPGDTLWSIATSLRSDQQPQQVMAHIVELNDLESSDLEPGQTLYIPNR